MFDTNEPNEQACATPRSGAGAFTAVIARADQTAERATLHRTLIARGVGPTVTDWPRGQVDVPNAHLASGLINRTSPTLRCHVRRLCCLSVCDFVYVCVLKCVRV